jgi:hypothetical protein
MPQYVLSQHHNYHHADNGNWDKFRGPYTTLSVDAYAAMTDAQQRVYRRKWSFAAAPLVGFIYLIFNPRFTWVKGSIDLVIDIVNLRTRGSGVRISPGAPQTFISINHLAIYSLTDPATKGLTRNGSDSRKL